MTSNNLADASPKPDDLKRIVGIGPGVEKRLHGGGILTFEQLAAASVRDISPLFTDMKGIVTVDKIEVWIARAGELVAAPLPPDSVDSVMASENHQHYETFKIELLLDDQNDVRRTHITHVQDGDDETWASWDEQRMAGFIAQHAAIRVPAPVIEGAGSRTPAAEPVPAGGVMGTGPAVMALPPLPPPAPQVVPATTRVETGQLALYGFLEGSGTVVNDLSGVEPLLPLQVSDLTAVRWMAGGGLSIDAETLLSSEKPATKIIDAVKNSGEITIEAWVKPAQATLDGPVRIVTVSEHSKRRNTSLEQGRWGKQQPSSAYSVRLRTSTRDNDGAPSLRTEDDLATADLSHLVYTRDSQGVAKFYLDGVERVSGMVDGDFSTWDDNYKLILASEETENKAWLGEFYIVAIYERALAANEVQQNFAAGHLLDGTKQEGDLTLEIVRVEIIETDGVMPSMIIGTDQAWSILVEWEASGKGLSQLTGSWWVQAFLESMGPGPEYELTASRGEMVLVSEHTQERNLFRYAQTIKVDPGTIAAGTYKLVIAIAWGDDTGHLRGEPSTFHEDSIVQLYQRG